MRKGYIAVRAESAMYHFHHSLGDILTLILRWWRWDSCWGASRRGTSWNRDACETGEHSQGSNVRGAPPLPLGTKGQWPLGLLPCVTVQDSEPQKRTMGVDMGATQGPWVELQSVIKVEIAMVSSLLTTAAGFICFIKKILGHGRNGVDESL